MEVEDGKGLGAEEGLHECHANSVQTQVYRPVLSQCVFAVKGILTVTVAKNITP